MINTEALLKDCIGMAEADLERDLTAEEIVALQNEQESIINGMYQSQADDMNNIISLLRRQYENTIVK